MRSVLAYLAASLWLHTVAGLVVPSRRHSSDVQWLSKRAFPVGGTSIFGSGFARLPREPVPLILAPPPIRPPLPPIDTLAPQAPLVKRPNIVIRHWRKFKSYSTKKKIGVLAAGFVVKTTIFMGACKVVTSKHTWKDCTPGEVLQKDILHTKPKTTAVEKDDDAALNGSDPVPAPGAPTTEVKQAVKPPPKADAPKAEPVKRDEVPPPQVPQKQDPPKAEHPKVPPAEPTRAHSDPTKMPAHQSSRDDEKQP